MEQKGVAIIADSQGKNYPFIQGVYKYIFEKKERKFPISLINIKETAFRDGEFKIKIIENIRKKECYLIHDSNKEPCKWYTELNFLLDAIRFSSPSEVNVVLPYTRFARQERKDESRISVNAKALAKMISQYADRGMTIDLHNSATKELFDIPFDNLYSSPVLIEYLEKKHPDILKNLVVVSPDVGGGKRVQSLVKRFIRKGINVGMAIGYKPIRETENKVGNIFIMGDVENKNCLVIDDIIDTGNTMIEVGRQLKKAGAKEIYVYGTHGLFTEGIEKFSAFDKVFVSDTVMTPNMPNLEIISLVNLFGEAIYRTIVGESLSDLFDG